MSRWSTLLSWVYWVERSQVEVRRHSFTVLTLRPMCSLPRLSIHPQCQLEAFSRFAYSAMRHRISTCLCITKVLELTMLRLGMMDQLDFIKYMGQWYRVELRQFSLVDMPTMPLPPILLMDIGCHTLTTLTLLSHTLRSLLSLGLAWLCCLDSMLYQIHFYTSLSWLLISTSLCQRDQVSQHSLP